MFTCFRMCVFSEDWHAGETWLCVGGKVALEKLLFR